MIVYSRDLSSGGHLGGPGSYTLRPLTYKELMRELSSGEVTQFRSYIRDLKSLIAMDSKAANAPMIDADYLVYLMKMVTIDEKMDFKAEITCPFCKEDFTHHYTTRDIKIKELNTIITDVTLRSGKVPIKMPTINEFLNFVDMLPPYNSTEWDVEEVKLYSLFHFGSKADGTAPIGITLNTVNDAVYEDIAVLDLLKEYMNNGIDSVMTGCPHCKRRGIAIEALSSVASLFRILLQHNELDRSKIYAREVRSDE